MKLIVNADNFGISRTVNQAVLECYNNGILTSVSIMPNMPAFEDAIRKLKFLNNISLGIHLNITEFKSKLRTKENNSNLYNEEGFFNKNFLQILLKSNDDDFMFEVEHEFRSQIESVLKYTKPDFLNSHRNIHSIPKIFNLVCKLATEYEIPAVRTQKEIFFLTEKFLDKTQWKNWLNKNLYLNFLKVKILNYFSEINQQTLLKYDLKTNDYIIGNSYLRMQDTDAIKQCLEKFKNFSGIVELICNPDLNEKNLTHLVETKAICSEELKKYLQDVELTSFREFQKELVKI